jgi:hypothetical protein
VTRATAVALLLLAFSFTAFAQDDPNVHEIPGTGISLKKPAAWRFEMTTPTLVLVQNPRSGAAFLLALQAMPTPPPDAAPELLAYTLKGFKQKHPDLVIEEPVHATTAAGRHAATTIVNYRFTKGSQTVHIRSRLILIPRDGGIALITTTSDYGSDESAGKEMTSILDSVKIAK